LNQWKISLEKTDPDLIDFFFSLVQEISDNNYSYRNWYHLDKAFKKLRKLTIKRNRSIKDDKTKPFKFSLELLLKLRKLTNQMLSSWIDDEELLTEEELLNEFNEIGKKIFPSKKDMEVSFV